MSNLISVFIQNAKHYRSKLYKLFSYAKFKSKKSEKKKKKVILFDTDGLTINRRLAQVVLQFNNNGYECLLRVSLNDYLKTTGEDYSKIVFDQTSPIRKEHYDLLVCGKDNTAPSCRRIIFNDSIKDFPNHIDSPFFYPLILHPMKIVNNAEEYINSLYQRKKGNRIGIVFIGSSVDTSYKPYESIIHNEYGMLSRLDVLSYVKEVFQERVFEPETKEEFYAAYNDTGFALRNRIVIIDRFHISGNEYFDILYDSIFHLWTCGDAFPYCHNQIEGMACGCIPVYEPFQNKALYKNMNDSNSIMFNNLNELKCVIQNILDNSYGNCVNSMSEAIRKLYVEDFSMNAFGCKVDRFMNSTSIQEEYYIHPPMYQKL